MAEEKENKEAVEEAAPKKSFILSESEARELRFGPQEIVLEFDGENLKDYKD